MGNTHVRRRVFSVPDFFTPYKRGPAKRDIKITFGGAGGICHEGLNPTRGVGSSRLKAPRTVLISADAERVLTTPSMSLRTP